MFYTLAVVTFGTAVPAGQFVPGIMIGSTYGRLVGMFVVNFYKKLNIEEGTWVSWSFHPVEFLYQIHIASKFFFLEIGLWVDEGLKLVIYFFCVENFQFFNWKP